ncbi:putative mitochondrial Dnaj-like protein [Leptomonas pyrrhocoris]|uniref:Putative mitochondrial Dnaj-like protein n=1 Tax=Leptomonas pyrrhocoris TaxID=157538 RepID=A0A0M9G616_LEPPY|nr:putative mitochondrial Dnaj-like protein [Leptomonas pyrrhocoris]KPA83113.1 putative mitochondrial Dnaj-like protein [Leptomonas pyrrhocoris]|eukprot:XP_015661552.1 putative mitochondrial Dnaj-like protein [Leptomonas pyrrhocoris]
MQRARVSAGGRLLAGRLRALPSSIPVKARASVSLPPRDMWCGVPALHTSYRFTSSSAASAAPRPGQHSFYHVLGVDTDATPLEVKASYRQLALRFHPDVADEEHRTQSEVLFRRVSEAYEVLSDPVRRRAHDHELGIQTRRKQGTAAAAAGASSSSSTSAARARKPTGAAGNGSARKKHKASPASGASARQRQQQQSSRYRKPFVRGDANRVFADAFDGKTLDEILFDVQRRRRQAAATERRASTSAATTQTPASSSSSSSTLPESALDHDARLRHVMEEAAESFARKAQRQYGHGILRHIHAAASSLPEGPAPPPARYMPFRPFVGMEVPAGVQTPPEPQLGRVLTPHEATMERTAEHDSAAAGKKERVAAQFYTHQYADGVLHTRMASLRKAAKSIEGMPHNMGQLYSYHRPY